MACGLAASGELTGQGIERINQLGGLLRSEIEGVCEGTSARITGYGSLSCIHFGDKREHELFHLHMLENGFYMARRGSIYLSLETTRDEVDTFSAAARDFFDRYRCVLAEPQRRAQ